MILTASHEQLIQTLLDRARTRMSERRLMHVIGVTHVITILAEIHKLDREAAVMAALVHDQSKELTPEKIEHDLNRYGEPLDGIDREFPRVWHGLHAAAWARHDLGIRDEAVLEATALHSTTDAEIGPLTRALYIADVCEPGRRNAAAGRLMAIAKADLDEGFRKALVHKIRYMIEDQHARLHPRSIRALKAWVGTEGMQALGLEPTAEPVAQGKS
ncbi:MAG: bis(5'-nucleosyl)-tetraphosphatase (symmetrical) YqeK [Candidatus Sumerlaeia bacterium]